MTVAFRAKRVSRFLGIIAIFAVVGPLAVTAVFALFLLVVGVPLLQLMLEFFELESLRGWLSIAAFLLIFFSLFAAVTPSILAGIFFAIASVYGGMNSLWVALAIVGCMVLFVVVLGFFVSPSESSPMLVPSIKGLQQSAPPRAIPVGPRRDCGHPVLAVQPAAAQAVMTTPRRTVTPDKPSASKVPDVATLLGRALMKIAKFIFIRKSRARRSFMPRWLELLTSVLYVLVVGPTIGGALFGSFFGAKLIMQSTIYGPLPAMMAVLMIVGLPALFGILVGILIAASALILFVLLYLLFRKGSFYLAVASGVLAPIVVSTLFFLRTGHGYLSRNHGIQPHSVGAPELGREFVVLALISAITAAICWYRTKPLHRLS